MHKRLAVLLAVLGLAGNMGWAEDGGKRYPGQVTIGTETWPGYILLYVARDKGLFKDEKVNVVVKRYVALGQLSKDYVAGKMQGRANLTLDAINEEVSGFDHKIVLAIDYSAGSDAIVAREGIRSVKDFKGKKVAFERNTLEEFFVSWALKENGLSLSDVIPVYGNPDETVKMVESGQADVAVSHEPFLSKLTQAGIVHTVYSSKDAPGLITDVLTFETTFVQEYPGTVQAILRAYFKAMDFYQKHPLEAAAVLAKEFQDTPESILAQLKGITLLNKKDNLKAFTQSSHLDSLYGNMRKTGEFVLQHGKMGMVDLRTSKMIDPQFVRKISP